MAYGEGLRFVLLDLLRAQCASNTFTNKFSVALKQKEAGRLQKKEVRQLQKRGDAALEQNTRCGGYRRRGAAVTKQRCGQYKKGEMRRYKKEEAGRLKMRCGSGKQEEQLRLQMRKCGGHKEVAAVIKQISLEAALVLP